MAQPPAELSSISTALDELSERIAKIADEMSRSGQNDIAHELFEVERALTPAQRRLTRLVNRK